LENPLGDPANTSTEVPLGPVILPAMAIVLPPPLTIKFFVRLVAETVNGCGAELILTVEDAAAKEPGSMPIM